MYIDFQHLRAAVAARGMAEAWMIFLGERLRPMGSLALRARAILMAGSTALSRITAM